jgi:hypothetical protein
MKRKNQEQADSTEDEARPTRFGACQDRVHLGRPDRVQSLSRIVLRLL